MGAIVKLNGFTFEKSLIMAKDPNWLPIMIAKLWEGEASKSLRYRKDGSIDFSLSEFDLSQVEDLLNKGLGLVGLLKVAIETLPARANADVPTYINNSNIAVTNTRQAKDTDGKLLFETLIDTNSGEESQGDPIMETYDTGTTRKKMWKEVSAPVKRNDGVKVMMFPSLTLAQYNQLKSEAGLLIKSLKQWEELKVDASPTGYGTDV